MTADITFTELINYIAQWIYDNACNVTTAKFNAIHIGFKNNDAVWSASISYSEMGYSQDYVLTSEVIVTTGSGSAHTNQRYAYRLTQDNRGLEPSASIKVSSNYITLNEKTKEQISTALTNFVSSKFNLSQVVSTNNLLQFLHIILEFCVTHLTYVCSPYKDYKSYYYLEYVNGASSSTYSKAIINNNVIIASTVAEMLADITNIIKNAIPVKTVGYSTTLNRT